jgi:hypothetical protein
MQCACPQLTTLMSLFYTVDGTCFFIVDGVVETIRCADGVRRHLGEDAHLYNRLAHHRAHGLSTATSPFRVYWNYIPHVVEPGQLREACRRGREGQLRQETVVDWRSGIVISAVLSFTCELDECVQFCVGWSGRYYTLTQSVWFDVAGVHTTCKTHLKNELKLTRDSAGKDGARMMSRRLLEE